MYLIVKSYLQVKMYGLCKVNLMTQLGFATERYTYLWCRKYNSSLELAHVITFTFVVH